MASLLTVAGVVEDLVKVISPHLKDLLLFNQQLCPVCIEEGRGIGELGSIHCLQSVIEAFHIVIVGKALNVFGSLFEPCICESRNPFCLALVKASLFSFEELKVDVFPMAVFVSPHCFHQTSLGSL